MSPAAWSQPAPAGQSGGRSLKVYRDPGQRGEAWGVWLQEKRGLGYSGRIVSDAGDLRRAQTAEEDLVATFLVPPGHYRLCAARQGADRAERERLLTLPPISADCPAAVPGRVLLTSMVPLQQGWLEAAVLYALFGLLVALFVALDLRARRAPAFEVGGWFVGCALCFPLVGLYLYRRPTRRALLGIEPTLWEHYKANRKS